MVCRMCPLKVAVKVLIFLAFPLEALSAQLTRRKDFFCHNEPVQINCAVESGVLEWRLNPQFFLPKSGSFIRDFDEVRRERTLLWSGLSVRLTYAAANATHMESTAHFIAAAEFHNMTITCAGQNEATMVLMLASDEELQAVNHVNLSLLLTWDEPFLSGRPSVDYYLVEVNQMDFNVTSPRAEAAVVYSESINITIRYSNCLELSPAAKLNIQGGEEPDTVMPTTSILGSTTVAIAEEFHCSGALTIPIFISTILGTIIVSVSSTLLLLSMLIKIKAKVNKKAIVVEKIEEPFYEDIKTSKGPQQLCSNSAYNFRKANN